MKKVCVVCGHELPLDRFPQNRRMPDGHLGWCFDCFKHREYIRPASLLEDLPKQEKKEQWRPKEGYVDTKEDVTKHALPKINVADRESKRAYMRAYYLANKEKLDERSRLYAQTEKGKAAKAEYSKKHYLANKEKYNSRSRNWEKSEKGREWKREYNRKFRERYKGTEKYKAARERAKESRRMRVAQMKAEESLKSTAV